MKKAVVSSTPGRFLSMRVTKGITVWKESFKGARVEEEKAKRGGSQ